MTPVGLAQLPLAFRLREGPSFANFVEGRNSGARDWAQAAASGQGEQSIYLWGAKGTGKTHLLEAACRLGCERGSEAVLLPLERWGQLSPGILAGLDQLSLVCVDDLENIAGRPEWEEQLFHLYNRAQESGTRLLMTGARVPASR